MSTIGSRVKEARCKAGLYQYQLASSARITQSTVARIERGLGAANFFTMADIARALGVSLDWLAYGDKA